MKKVIIFLGITCSFLGFSQKKWTLEESIDYAKNNNLQIITSKFTEKLEEKNLHLSKRNFLPSISANMNNNIKFGQTQGFQGGIGRNDNFNNDIGMSVDMVIYSGNKIKKQVEQKQIDLSIAKYNTDILKYDITLQIIEQYLTILLNKEIYKVNKSAFNNAQKLYDKIKITTEIETTAKTVLAEAEATLARESQNMKIAEINIKKGLFALAQTLQLDDYSQFDIEDISLESPINISINNSSDEILKKIYSNHPKIKLAEQNIESAEIQSKIAMASFLPTISLNARLGSFYYNSLVTDITGVDSFGNIIKEKTLFDQYKTNFSQQVGLSINIPIFNKGITKIQVEQAKINEDIAKNNLNIKKQELLQNIQKVYFDIENYYANYLYAIETHKSNELALDFAQKSYEAGKITIYDLNVALNNFINAQGTLIQMKYNYIFSQKVLNFYINQSIK